MNPDLASGLAAVLVAFASVVGLLLLRAKGRPENGSGKTADGRAPPRPTVACAGISAEAVDLVRRTHDQAVALVPLVIDTNTKVGVLWRILVDPGEDGVPRSRQRLMHEEVMRSVAASIATQTETSKLSAETQRATLELLVALRDDFSGMHALLGRLADRDGVEDSAAMRRRTTARKASE